MNASFRVKHHLEYYNYVGGGGPTSAENGNATKGNPMSSIRRNPSMRLGASGLYIE